MSEVEIITDGGRRRRWSSAEKLRIVEETLDGSESISAVARRNGVAPNLLYRWRKLMLEGVSVAVTVAEMLILVGDNPDRIQSEAALAKLCGVCPIPVSSGKTNRMRLNRGGNRQANAAVYRVAIVRMRDNHTTKAYAARRKAEGKTRREIVRCIKRYIVREIYRALCAPAARAPAA